MNVNKIISGDSHRYEQLKSESPECVQKNVNPAQYPTPYKPWKLFVFLIGMVNIFLMGVIVLQSKNSHLQEAGFDGLPKSPIPKLPPRPYAFRDDDRFRNLDTLAKVESAWVSIFPQGNGFIHLPNPTLYSLSPNAGVPINSVITSSPNAYIISAYHQLHCLMLLHCFHVHMLTTHLSNHSDPKEALLTPDETNHAEHCFIYLRQGVLCSADTTLEQPDVERDEEGEHVGHNPLHGWGTEHVCRDWGVLGEWAEGNAAF